MNDRLTDLRRGAPRINLADAPPCSSVVSRAINRDILLELIRTHQPVSRVNLARLSGLQRSTVSLITEQLFSEGWVRVGSTIKPARGRSLKLLTLNDQLRVLVVDIQTDKVVVALVDLNGNVLNFSPRCLDSDPSITMRYIIGALKQLRADYPPNSVLGIGVSVPGLMDRQSQKLVFVSRLGMVPAEVKRTIEAQTGLDVVIDHAANCCLISELRFARMEGVRNAVLVNISEEISAGILADGRLIAGHHGTAGEFGHVQVDPSGPACECGQKGCWESVASTKAALRYFRELSPGTNGISFQRLLNLEGEGDVHARVAVTLQATKLGDGLRMIAYALSPEVILVAGDVTAAWERFKPTFEEALRTPPLPSAPPRLLPIRGVHIARIRGAAAALLQRAITRPVVQPDSENSSQKGRAKADR